MKLTANQLRRIIKEEVQRALLSESGIGAVAEEKTLTYAEAAVLHAAQMLGDPTSKAAAVDAVVVLYDHVVEMLEAEGVDPDDTDPESLIEDFFTGLKNRLSLRFHKNLASIRALAMTELRARGLGRT